MGFVLDLLLNGIKSSRFRRCPQELSLYAIAYVAGAKAEKFQGFVRARGEERRRGPSFLFACSSLALY